MQENVYFAVLCYVLRIFNTSIYTNGLKIISFKYNHKFTIL